MTTAVLFGTVAVRTMVEPAPTYAVYKGPENLYLEMGPVYVLPRVGDKVTITTTHYTVIQIEWDIFPPVHTVQGKPQQFATVVLRKRRFFGNLLRTYSI